MGKGFLALLVCGLAACSLVGKPIAEEFGRVIDRYCALESYEARRLYNAEVNRYLDDRGHYIALACANDPN